MIRILSIRQAIAAWISRALMLNVEIGAIVADAIDLELEAKSPAHRIAGLEGRTSQLLDQLDNAVDLIIELKAEAKARNDRTVELLDRVQHLEHALRIKYVKQEANEQRAQ